MAAVVCGVVAALPFAVPSALAADRSSAQTTASAATTAKPGESSIGVGSDPDGVAVDAATGTVYVANEGDGTVSVIDAATGTATATIPVGAKPRGIAVDATTDTVYVANSGDGTVSVIDGKTATVTGTPKVGADADAVAVDAATDTIYVSWYDGIATIDGATNTVTPEAIYVPLTGIDDDLAIDPALHRLYVVTIEDYQVAVIDTTTNQQVSYYQVGMTPDAVAVDLTHQLLYVGNCQASYFSGLWVINLTTGDTIAQLNTGCPAAVAADPASTTGYSVDADNDEKPGTLSLVGGSPDEITATMGAGEAPDAMDVDPATGTVYVANDTVSGTVTAITPAAPAFAGARAATFTVGKASSFTVTASGYPKVAFATTSTLPRGVTFASAGILKGTPAARTGGVYPLWINAGNGIAPDPREKVTLTVDQSPAFVSAGSATFRHGSKNTFTVKTTGFPAAVIAEKGRLPSGVTFRAGKNGTAVLSGTPAKAAAGHKYLITLTAANAAGSAAAQSFTLRVS